MILTARSAKPGEVLPEAQVLAPDGQGALAFLRAELTLCDLHPPRRDGRKLSAENDLHAPCCLTKPVEFDPFIELVKSIEGFWLSIVKAPSEQSTT